MAAAGPASPPGPSYGGHVPTLTDRMLAACGASVVSALVVNPLDVVKTRMQAQSAAVSLQRLPAVSAEQQFLRLADLRACGCPAPLAPQALKGGCYASADCSAFGSTLDGVRKIARREGVRGLWRGVDTALVMAVPTVGIYLPLYEYLSALVQPRIGEAVAPLVAGSVARAASICCTSPLELLRTRQQAAGSKAAGVGTGGPALERLQGAAAGLAALPRGHRLRAMWTGVGGGLAPFCLLQHPTAAVGPGALHGLLRSLRTRLG